MLRFFRHIRKSLMEQNKIRTYLLYAVGEILLVVIGILIALQVNNWNEERKALDELSQYTVSIISDIAQDTLLLQRTIYNLEELIAINEEVIHRINTEEANLDTRIYLASEKFTPLNTGIDNYNTSIFEAILATGSLGLFKKEIRDKIFELRQSQLNSLDPTNSDIYFNKANEFGRYFPLFDSNIEDKTYAMKLRNEITDERTFTMLFTGLVDYKSFMLNSYRSFYREVLASSKELIEILKRRGA